MSEPMYETVTFLKKSKIDGVELFGGAFIVCTTSTGHTVLRCRKAMADKTINELIAIERREYEEAIAKKRESK